VVFRFSVTNCINLFKFVQFQKTVRYSAIENIQNDEILFKIALNDSDANNRQLAAKKIVSEDLLAKLALDSKHLEVLRTVINCITSKEKLLTLKILSNNRNSNLINKRIKFLGYSS
jgi:hypothetical protein